ncbi:hypothetical protein CDL15_Pgr020807 [Punica granatum]|uniref:Uncharacterized protein n=1 Tax=Punica granatum TaxID=22663 RepID=A0A218XV67_PUNGR|nr:hypothetical protein CDL15_Pgr020807 [Punica granatum]PKI54799.1 hypothetical protein CRG98_024813 [Punica granatum]
MGQAFGLGLQKNELGRGPVSQGRSGSGGRRRPGSCGGQFSPLDAAMSAGIDAGYGSGHRSGIAVVDRGLTGV